jgi:catechol 2,3-dioxygenase-like lactoylglutathione lyase family enzyme
MAQAVGEKTRDAASLFTGAFSSFSVNDLKAAKDFYGQTLGLDVGEETEGLALTLENGARVFLYPKDDHTPATFTVLNFKVGDIAAAAEELRKRGIKFEFFGGNIKTDENGIFWGAKRGEGPNIAWFKDPAGNFLSIIEG